MLDIDPDGSVASEELEELPSSQARRHEYDVGLLAKSDKAVEGAADQGELWHATKLNSIDSKS